MAGDVQFEMTGNDRRAIAALRRAESKIDALEKKTRDLNREGRKSNQTFTKAFDFSQVTRFATALTGAGGVLAAVQAIRDEYDKILDRQTKAAQAITGVAGGRERVQLQLLGVPQEQRARAFAGATAIARETGTPEATVLNALADALSASSQNIDAALSATRTAAETLRNAPEALNLYAGAMLDMAKVTGTTDAEVNRGVLLAVGALTRVTDPLKQARNIPPALIGVRAFGATTAEAGALFAALSSAAADPLGEQSRTASISFASQLAQFFDPRGQVGKSLARRGGIPQGFGAQLSFLQENERFAQKFLDESSFEKAFIAPIADLVRGEGVASRDFAAALTKIPSDFAAAGAQGGELIRSLRTGDTATILAEAQRQFSAVADQIRVGDTRGAAGAIARTGLFDVLDAAGEGALAGKINRALFEVQTSAGMTDPFGFATAELERRADELTRTEFVTGGGSRLNPGGIRTQRQPSERDLEIAGSLQQMIVVLEETRDLLKRNGSESLSKPDIDPGLPAVR